MTARMARPVPSADSLPMSAVLPRAHPEGLTTVLDWFPQDTTFVGAFDVQAVEPLKSLVRPVLEEFLPPRLLPLLADEALGAVQIDRVAFAYSEDKDRKPTNARRFVRVTGKADRERLTNILREAMPRVRVVDKYLPDGKLVREFSSELVPVAVALVGDTDLILAGYEDKGRPVEALWQALDVRARRELGVLDGPLAPSLQKASPEAIGLLLGRVPTALRNELSTTWQLPVVLDQVALEVRPLIPFTPPGTAARRPEQVSVLLDVSLAKGNGEALKESLLKWKRLGYHALEDLPPQLALPAEAVPWLQQALDTTQMFGNGTRMVGAKVVLPRGPVPVPVSGGKGEWGGFSSLWPGNTWSPQTGPFQITLAIPTKALPPLGEVWKALRTSPPGGSRGPAPR